MPKVKLLLRALAGTAAAVDPSAAMLAGMAGAVLSGIGDIHAVDTIRDGVRDTHILMRKPSGEAPAVAMPGMTPTPAKPGKPAASTESAEDEEEVEEAEDADSEEEAEEEADEEEASSDEADTDDEWISDDWQ